MNNSIKVTLMKNNEDNALEIPIDMEVSHLCNLEGVRISKRKTRIPQI